MIPIEAGQFRHDTRSKIVYMVCEPEDNGEIWKTIVLIGNKYFPHLHKTRWSAANIERDEVIDVDS